MATTEAAYTLDNTWAKAHRRLTLIEEMCDVGTTARMASLGVRPGWRCLELGAGAGSIARWLSDRVGSDGRVTAVDLEPHFLLEDPRDNMDVVRQDIVADGIPGDGYDLIHARALLMHLPNREELIRDLLARLRPGGAILLEEADFYPLLATASGAVRDVIACACEVAKTRGGDWTWARHLPNRLTAAGAAEVAAVTVELPMVAPGNLMGEFCSLTLEQISPLLLATGLSAGALTAAVAQLAGPECWHSWFVVIAASARRPA